MSLRAKAIKGVSWSAINLISSNFVQFIIGIILARILSPAEYGLIGMTAIFTALSQTFVDSGLTTALIRKKTCTQTEYSTVFYYNIVLSFLVYSILFGLAPKISAFLNEPQLTKLIRIIGINILILASSQIQRSILIKRIAFKKLTIITTISMLISGIIAVLMATEGYGIWSLVVLLLSRNLFISIQIWLTNSWTPSIIFSISAFKELFGFGSKILFASLLNTAYENMYGLVIAKYFSVSDLGFYTRAKRFSNLIGKNINSVIQRVSFPILATISDDIPRLRKNYKILITTSSQLSSFFSFAMAATAPAFVTSLLGSKWNQSIPYLQLLSLAGMLYPIHSLNLNILKVMGRSDLFLKLEIYKKLLAVPTIFIGIIYGLLPMMGMILFSSIIAFFINSSNSGKLIGYSTKEQLNDIIPSLFVSVMIAAPVYITGLLLPAKSPIILVVQIVLTLFGAFFAGKYSRYSGIVEIREVAVSQFYRLKNRN